MPRWIRRLEMAVEPCGLCSAAVGHFAFSRDTCKLPVGIPVLPLASQAMPSLYRSRTLVCVVSAVMLLGACGDDDESTGPTLDVLLSTNVLLSAGVTCATGGVNKDFSGTAGKTVVITASGPSTLTPQITLYAPDFETQLAGSASTGAGKAALTQALTETGTHHLSVCDANGVGGSLNLVVTQQ
jgi:hypothetical protein